MATRSQPGSERVPGYRLLCLLGKGTFGEVWRASGPGGTDSALKIIPLHADSGLKELRTLALIKNIKHPHLLPITGLWLLDDDGQVMSDDALQRADPGILNSVETRPATLIVAMLLCDRSLLDLHKAFMKRGEPGIPRDELLKYIEEAASGLDFLNEPRHDLGKGPVAIQHRDVKPENLLLVGGSVVVGDFGVARVLDQQSVTATSMVGSPAYMAPECINGEHIARTTDQYSLALTYFSLRTGTLPFADGANYFAVINCHVRGELNLKKVCRSERRVLERATSLDPNLRYNSCLAMVQALRAAAARGDAEARKKKTQRVTDTDTAPLDTPPNLPDIDGTETISEVPSDPVDGAVVAAEASSPDAPVPVQAAGRESGSLDSLGSVAMNHAAKDYLRLLLQKKLPSLTLLTAWDDFYAVYSDLVRRILVGQGIAAAQAEEYVREVWASVAANLLALDQPPKELGLRAWLLRSLQLHANELLIRKATDDVLAEGKVVRHADPTHEDWSRLLFVCVLEALKKKVSNADYQILLSRLKGQTAEEVADALQLPIEQVRYRYFKVSRKLEVGMALFSGRPSGNELEWPVNSQ